MQPEIGLFFDIEHFPLFITKARLAIVINRGKVWLSHRLTKWLFSYTVRRLSHRLTTCSFFATKDYEGPISAARTLKLCAFHPLSNYRYLVYLESLILIFHFVSKPVYL